MVVHIIGMFHGSIEDHQKALQHIPIDAKGLLFVEMSGKTKELREIEDKLNKVKRGEMKWEDFELDIRPDMGRVEFFRELVKRKDLEFKLEGGASEDDIGKMNKVEGHSYKAFREGRFDDFVKLHEKVLDWGIPRTHTKRNQWWIDEIKKEYQKDPNRDIYLPVGAAHPPFIQRELDRAGVETRRYGGEFIFGSHTEYLRRRLMGQNISEQKREELLGRSVVESFLHNHMRREGIADNANNAKLARGISSKMTIDDVKELSRHLAEKKADEKSEIKFAVEWMKEKGIIKEGDFNGA